jgi:hypothetical protein
VVVVERYGVSTWKRDSVKTSKCVGILVHGERSSMDCALSKIDDRVDCGNDMGILSGSPADQSIEWESRFLLSVSGSIGDLSSKLTTVGRGEGAFCLRWWCV